jgi:hypothetical protein
MLRLENKRCKFSVLTQFLKMSRYRTFGLCAEAILDLVHWV